MDRVEITASRLFIWIIDFHILINKQTKKRQEKRVNIENTCTSSIWCCFIQCHSFLQGYVAGLTRLIDALNAEDKRSIQWTFCTSGRRGSTYIRTTTVLKVTFFSSRWRRTTLELIFHGYTCDNRIIFSSVYWFLGVS